MKMSDVQMLLNENGIKYSLSTEMRREFYRRKGFSLTKDTGTFRLFTITNPNHTKEIEIIFTDTSDDPEFYDLNFGGYWYEMFGCREIADEVFAGIEQLMNVTLPVSVYRIGAEVFCGCINLHKINLEKVTEMGNYAFCNTGLESVFLGDMDLVPKGAFMGCEHLSEVIFSDTIRKVEELAFDSCIMLKEIDLKNAEIIESDAFDNCIKLKKIKVRRLKDVGYSSFPYEATIEYPEVENGAVISDIRQITGETLYFEKARSDRNWYYGDSGIYFEYGYQNLKDVVADEAYFEGWSLKGKVDERFREKIRCIIVPEDVVKIESGTFADCINLEMIVLHDGMEICEGAFKNCPKLKSVVIDGYDSERCRFFVNEYYDALESMPVRPFCYKDTVLGYCDHIGEASLRQDPFFKELKQHDNNYWKNMGYCDSNIIFRSHWIRINYYAFDDFTDLYFCSGFPYDFND